MFLLYSLIWFAQESPGTCSRTHPGNLILNFSDILLLIDWRLAKNYSFLCSSSAYNTRLCMYFTFLSRRNVLVCGLSMFPLSVRELSHCHGLVNSYVSVVLLTST